MTLTSESGYQKEQGRRCLYPTALPMSTEQFSLIPLLALVLFFPLQPDLSAISPANEGFVTSQQGLLNAKRGSRRL